ncbi:MAG: hypothetical protein Q9164_006586 [Protoblastenia rupestris]
MANVAEDEAARRWKLEGMEEEGRVRRARIEGVGDGREGEWRRLEEVMEGVAPKRRRIDTGSAWEEVELVGLTQGRAEERATVAGGRKRKGKG